MYDALIVVFKITAAAKHRENIQEGQQPEPEPNRFPGFCLRIPQKTEVTGSSLRTAARRMHGLLRIRINILHTVLKE